MENTAAIKKLSASLLVIAIIFVSIGALLIYIGPSALGHIVEPGAAASETHFALIAMSSTFFGVLLLMLSAMNFRMLTT